MTKYNSYAHRLDALFRSASDECSKAYNTLKEAKDAAAANKAHKTAYQDALSTFRKKQQQIWDNFTTERSKLTRELQNAISSDAINPDDLEAEGLEAIRLADTPEDLAVLANKYMDNSSMIRQVAKRADTLAASGKDRSKYIYITRQIRDIQNSITTNWDRLNQVADTYSGIRSGNVDPEYRLKLASRWNDDPKVQAAIEEF